ncbi:MAG: PaaX domain protein [Candidatus Gottesmanbacteria bacterium GW2011_GWB1_43_11]|uniref:PaaX domain protein n=1 Tax=Candidatus Gottesmanbacteria bacterium GW2011_GWB1_43_11 TaxID=1618446 RepID=A0A0G1FEK3_9BACT|nr:MAG: PaaX domain protein [Candidatus Gottesmanbacteria bacterium GW2011_GWA2_42_16]KKS54426.1 MAG: PaaX domain protein [Candidatus Gottesmanbacteria bacterium GW2011_GWA1_42_26]KKS80160.1 MAG: repressor in the phenylacetic acid catabolic pathway, phenylacetic acid degradation operon negative regulatory protein [Candidatus Gottesmanbacteria bacterium GW2011_GWC1_43_10]KKS85278.1 MAG: PaaX domain protein [Candidatus Gottesmanbacteria bacterium GW2011_GWB1_43_11]OGG27393.1 MAG: hypothetical pro
MKNISTASHISPQVKDVLRLLGAGTLLVSLFMFPGAGLGIGAIYSAYKKLQREKDYEKWKKYNLPRLKFILRRLHKQKLVTTVEKSGVTSICLTKKGKLKTLKYKLEEMEIDRSRHWDGKWRLVIYDISKFKRKQQEALRRMLKKLKLLQLQKSVYLTPYPCDNEINFLREYFGVSEGVLYIIAEKLENSESYKEYFGI